MTKLGSILAVLVLVAAVNGGKEDDYKEFMAKRQKNLNSTAPRGEKREDNGDESVRKFDGVDLGDYEFSGKSMVKSGSSKSALQFALFARSVPRLAVRYMAKSADTKAGFAVRMAFLRIVEYNASIPVNASTRFLGFHSLGPKLFNKMVHKKRVGDDGATVYTASSTLAFSSDAKFGNFNFTISALITDKFTSVNDSGSTTVLAPDGIKYSIAMSDWPYKLENGRLAIVHSFFTRDSKVSANSQSGFGAMNISGEAGRFLWDKTVIVDGVSTTIETDGAPYENAAFKGEGSLSADEEDESGNNPRFVNFILPAGANKILWDPELGANADALIAPSAAGTSSDAVSNALFGGVVFSLVGAFATMFL